MSGEPGRPCQALLIDASAQTITATSYRGIEGLHKLVGGYFEAAYAWPNGDVLYVDEDGLDKPDQAYFGISVRPDQMLAGNGVIVGREVDEMGNTAPPQMPIEWLYASVLFMGPDATTD